jgi:S-adenosylmethionine-diacylglycerol 3-amino-3-carboxypropyl transferase
MPRSSNLQFAVVREDPGLEARLLQRMTGRRVFLIASGGCTALHLLSEFPGLQLTALDANPAQLRHVQAKLDALSRGDGLDAWQALSQCGNFESLFRSLRLFLEDMVAAPEEWERLLQDASLSPEPIFSHKYWSVAFDLFFHDRLLVAMFGPHAIQHASPGSYPRYFQSVFERGLTRPDRVWNYFLHHILLGRYLSQALPEFLRKPSASTEIRLVQDSIEHAPDFAGYDLISLSNLFDWMDAGVIAKVTDRLSREARPGAFVLLRQLNNHDDFRPRFAGFRFHTALAQELLAGDRSLFYNRLLIAEKEAP